MATDPFSSGTIARLENRTQAYRFDCIIGEVVAFRFWCCDQPPALGVTKAPACILDVNPEVQCDNVNIIFDISNSYSPTGSLVGGLYEVDYGNGVTTGAIAWPGGGPAPWNYAYPAAGVYTVTAYVTDTLGVRGTTAMTVEIVDCANNTVLIEQMYALSDTTGPWVKDVTAGGAPPPWTQRIVGLAGLWLVGRDLKLDPHRKHLNYGQRHVWMTSQAGPARSADDMAAWSRLYDLLPEPRNDDGGAATKANLDWYTIAFNPMNRDEVYILAGTATRSWIYFTFDGGATWDNWQCRW
jgi:hypothetical protein